MHPLQPDITSLSDQELEGKVNELTKKYFQALRFVPGAAHQITILLDGYKWEQQRRIIERQKRSSDNQDESYNDLIKVD